MGEECASVFGMGAKKVLIMVIALARRCARTCARTAANLSSVRHVAQTNFAVVQKSVSAETRIVQITRAGLAYARRVRTPAPRTRMMRRLKLKRLHHLLLSWICKERLRYFLPLYILWR